VMPRSFGWLNTQAVKGDRRPILGSITPLATEVTVESSRSNSKPAQIVKPKSSRYLLGDETVGPGADPPKAAGSASGCPHPVFART
jgi:hypothetical protein